ncbi:MAG: SDR family oxidoreductase [Mesorhizobium sp.]|uniref:SDR family oxidoreductase n=1 Tax=Mesorhizobium sp. TaxID=1871066 RepID=UPI000FE6852D|nr:SDR family oxidoreductase [Mesorhizobium sp.]RWO54470.1 MAG: SDR family oxidoreductase [Mesorhizobium sp.]TIM34524.1 MAG: SDR family oxidoreductase [Mesorhizobium sp.]TIM80123.1 MAG: SDR family oxidoreductase [Mesorhizobium sp.]
MSKIFIVGGAGKVGRRLAQQLSERGHRPLSLYRKPEQRDELTALGATPIEGDLIGLSIEDLADMMKGCSTAVFSAGAGGAGMAVTNAIDGAGLEKAVEAAKVAGVQRFLLVSVFPDALRDQERKEGFENYIKVKKLADAYLVSSGLDYVIVRPGTLTEETGRGCVRADLAVPYGKVPRDDVAAVLAEIVDRPDIARAIIELTEGETPVSEAIARLA